MRDVDVRTALKTSLADAHRGELESTRIVDELGLCGLVRVDVAVVNGLLAGYELKSARDSLDRLPNQVKVYSEVLDHAVLVVAENHLRSARRLLKPWWGIQLARGEVGNVSLDTVREAKMNPKIVKTSLAQLLWKPEAIEALEVRGLSRGVKAKPRHEAWGRLADSLDLDDLRGVVRDALKARRGWRVDPTRDVHGGKPQPSHTRSRFLDRRIH